MITLGIETSCDETACAILEGPDSIRSNIVSSSLFRHQPFGGIVPEIASRHCLEQIDFVLEQALRQAKISLEGIDLIAVTQGPGLIGSLLVGICFAKTLSYQLGIPLIDVNHLEAHLQAPFLKDEDGSKPDSRPEKFLGLLVSGGHSSITLHDKETATLIGETIDDAVGEAYDKVAKILGLAYPGGPIIDQRAKKGNAKATSFTKPKQKNPYDFSFSGIKTAVLYYFRDKIKEPLSEEDLEKLRNDISASFQEAVVSWIVSKSVAAAKEYKVSDIVIGGGVSANSYLRNKLKECAAREKINVWIPHLSLTGDNAAMIASRGYELFQQGRRASISISGDSKLRVI